MKINYKLNLFLIVSAVILGGILTGCGLSHTNPLLKNPPKKTASFIYHAQNYAIEKTKLYDMNGSAYLACLQNPHHFDNPLIKDQPGCRQLFKEMIAYGENTNKFKAYRGLEMQDLMDPLIIKKLGKLIEYAQNNNGEIEMSQKEKNEIMNQKAFSKKHPMGL